jgi:hypothetical protein
VTISIALVLTTTSSRAVQEIDLKDDANMMMMPSSERDDANMMRTTLERSGAEGLPGGLSEATQK